MPYKLATYQSPQGPRAGAVINDQMYDVAALTGRANYVSTQDVLDDWDAAHAALDAASKAPKGQGQPLSQVKLRAPILKPGTIYCAVETSGDGAVNFQSRVQMYLFKAKQVAQQELEEALRKTNLTIDQVREFLAEHPRFANALHRAPHPEVIERRQLIVYRVANLVEWLLGGVVVIADEFGAVLQKVDGVHVQFISGVPVCGTDWSLD